MTWLDMIWQIGCYACLVGFIIGAISTIVLIKKAKDNPYEDHD